MSSNTEIIITEVKQMNTPVITVVNLTKDEIVSFKKFIRRLNMARNESGKEKAGYYYRAEADK